MDDLISHFLNAISSTEVTTESAIFKMLVSMALGGAVGFERKRKGQIAGMRTFALIAMGATMAMLLSIYIPQEYLGLKNGDPGRIAAQVITGIGFLGAGAIIQMKGSVRGLTTAAGIWIVATIGMAVGVGLYFLATVSTALILVILIFFERYERKVNLEWENKILRIVVDGTNPDIDAYRKVFDHRNMHLADHYLKVNYSQNESIINFVVLLKNCKNYGELFDELHSIEHTKSISLTNELNI
ncbi:MAG: MgtC/SapB family protein [Muribaculaceae bacterium]